MSLKNEIISIGLCLPGGGFRASGFCLGILSMLHEMEMIKLVQGLSTVSGGTITGIKYAQMMRDGETFASFYDSLYDWLKDNQLTNEAIQNLKNKRIWNEQYAHKRRNLINAFALEYQKFIPGTLGSLERYCALESTTLKRTIFNSTDFTHGVEFRFQNKDLGQRDFGNAYQDVFFRDIRAHIKLGDIAAASSCFPAGFEPMAFPNDFISDQEILKSVPSEAQTLGLMDGGIIDNQGISSFMTGSKLPYDLYLIGDVGASSSEPFTFSDHLPAARWIAAIANRWFFFGMVLLTIAAITLNIFFLKYLFVALTTVLATLHLLLFWAYGVAGKMANIEGSFVLDHRLLGIYLLDRIRSVVTLNNVIFLRGAKSRNVSNIFSRARQRTEKISIYELADFVSKTPENPQSHKQQLVALIGNIPPHLIKASTQATDFATTLWFEDNRGQMLDALVLTGRATTCLSLMSFLLKKTNVATCREDPFFQILLRKWQSL